jgi:hypothetical protein
VVADLPGVRKKLRTLSDLGYLTLGEDIPALSGVAAAPDTRHVRWSPA